MAALKNFRAARWVRTINLIFQAILFVTLFLGLNFLARDYYGRFDLTRLRRHSLSPETRSYLQHLARPVTVVVTEPEDPNDEDSKQAQRDIKELLREYAYIAEHNATNKITVTYLDIYQRPREAKQLGIDKPNTVIFFAPEKREEVTVDKLYHTEHKKRTAFLGEKVFTEAILDVASLDTKKVYLLVGHGEMEVNSIDRARGLSDVRDVLRERNFYVDLLDLGRTPKIPDDAAVIISAGATSRYEGYEQELLRQYLTTRAGRLMLLVSPGINPTGLETLLEEWGLLADDVWVRDASSTSQTDAGDLMLLGTGYQKHPITQTVAERGQPLRFGATRMARRNPSASDELGLSAITLVRTSKTARGERDSIPIFNDMLLGVAAASERTRPQENIPFSVRGGRVVLVGCADFIANERYRSRGNGTFFLSALNWLSDREAQLNVPARPIEKFQLSLTTQEFFRLRSALLFILPGAALLLGLIVQWTRRR